MTTRIFTEHDPDVRAAIEQLKAAISERYPQATFEVFHRDDPDGIRLRTTVDIEDTEEVLDAVIDPLYEFQVERALPVYVIPVQPAERIRQQLAADATSVQLRSGTRH